MLSDFSGAKVYLACGYTDLRRGIDGLATIMHYCSTVPLADGRTEYSAAEGTPEN